MVSSNFALALPLTSFTASSTLRFALPAKASRTARLRFPSFAILLHLDAHGTCAADDDLHRSFDVVCVQVFPLGFRDFANLLNRDRTSCFASGHFAARLQLGRLFEIVSRRRRL